MGLIARLFGREKRATGVSNPANWLFDSLGGQKTSSGERIDEDAALTISAVWAAVQLLSQSVASLPMLTYERLEPRGKRRASDHPLSPLLHGMVNPRMTSFEWRETSMAHLLLRGNAFSLIERDGGARVTEILPLRPDYMRVHKGPEDNQILYVWEPPDLPPIVRAAGSGDILHIRGFATGDGILGLSPISYARESLGTARASERYAGRWFGNGAAPSGVLTHPGTLGGDAITRLKESVNEFRGATNAHKTMILEEGMDWKQIGIAPGDSQLLESRKFGVNDVARWFHVPPHMIGDLDRATFSNVEQQALDFVVHSVRPWLVRWEQAVHRDMLIRSERQRFFVEFLVDGLLRGELKSRYEAYAIGRNNGWLSPNDILELENRNPISEEQGGDDYLRPLNMTIPAEAEMPTQPAIPTAAEDRARELRSQREKVQRRAIADRREFGQTFESLVADAGRKLIRAEIRELKKVLDKLAAADAGTEEYERLLERVRTLYGGPDDEGWRKLARQTMTPPLLGLARLVETSARSEVDVDLEPPALEPFVAEIVAAFVARHAVRSERQILDLAATHRDDLPKLHTVVTARLVEWEETRPAQIAKRETVRTRSATARRTYRALGVTQLVWRASGENCPFCTQLNGRVIGIEEHFATEGEEFPAEGRSPLRLKTNIAHPPIHNGCDCDIAAVTG